MKKIVLILASIFVFQNTFAAVHSVENISEKVKGDRLSLSDVNSILGTIRGFFFDDSTGFVGVGTDSPEANLHVKNGSFVLGNTDNYNTTFINISTNEEELARNEIYFRGENGDTDWSIRNMNNSFDILNFQDVANGSNFSISQEGNVGIGTSSPAARLEIANDATYMRMKSKDDSIASIGFTSSSDTVVSGIGHDFVSGKLFLSQGGSAFSNAAFVLQSNGNVGIGTTSPNSKLDVRGNVSVGINGNWGVRDNGGGTQFVIENHKGDGWNDTDIKFAVDNSGNAYANGILLTSDSRYKKEIQTLPSALEKVSALRGVSYQWKDRNDDSTKIGVVAQEIEKVYPELVHTDEDGYKSVAYSNLVAPMIEAIKELNQTVIELQSQVQQLQNAQN